MKALKVTKKNVPTKGRAQKSKKPENTKETNKSSTNSSLLQSSSRKPNATGTPHGSTSAVQTAADERRLRKLKVYLKSVSYNGCEGTILPNLNDLYADQLLVDEFPCNELSKNEEFKCNPTTFVIASCFNRRQVTENSNNDKGNKGARRTPRKQTSNTPRKRNPQNADSIKTSKQESPLKASKSLMLQQLKSPLSAEKTNPARKLFNEQGDKLGQVTLRRKEESSCTKAKSPEKLDEKKSTKDKK